MSEENKNKDNQKRGALYASLMAIITVAAGIMAFLCIQGTILDAETLAQKTGWAFCAVLCSSATLVTFMVTANLVTDWVRNWVDISQGDECSTWFD